MTFVSANAFAATVDAYFRAASRHAWRIAALLVLVAVPCARAQSGNDLRPPTELKGLSLEELLNTEVTSVSKTPERWWQTASAIQVITAEDIRRSGATSLPEVLRLAPNLEVAQLNAHDWAVTARGFNGAPLSNSSLADKLLVLIDGRSVYTPLFGGVFWDVQDVLLEDVDRIEVISGPGGTLWGANAVNGVINVVTRHARDTRGVYASAATGSTLQDLAELRVGGGGDRFAYRVFAQHRDDGDTETASGASSLDGWNRTRGGFRIDWSPTAADAVTLLGDAYGGEDGDPVTARVNGQDVTGRWTRTLSRNSDLAIQFYVDRTSRTLPTPSFRDILDTYDIDVQHHFPVGARHDVLWGASYRLMRDDVRQSVPVSFLPAQRELPLFGGFVQDQIALVPGRLALTLGSKIEHNVYSGVDLQPGARLAWTPVEWHMLWAAVSRAVRSPSRFDVDTHTPNFVGDSEFQSEKLTAYELGTRLRPIPRVTLSAAAFENRYTDVRAVVFAAAPPPPLAFANGQRAATRGVELTAAMQAMTAWRVSASYSLLDWRIRPTRSDVFPGSDLFEAIDPHHRVLVRSAMDFGAHAQLDLIARAVSALPTSTITPRIPAYGALDARASYRLERLELAVTGQNLWRERHTEFATFVPRSVHGTVTCRF